MRATKWVLLLFVVTGVLTSAARAQIPEALMDALISSRGRIGAQVQPMTPELRAYFEAPSDRGILVTQVEPDRPAAKGGVLVGDIIVAVGTKTIHQPFDLLRAMNLVPLGETVDLTIVRAKGEMTVRVTPDGEPNPWIDPEHWRDALDEHLKEGAGQLHEQMEKLQRRLEELEREFEEHREENENEGQKT
jgi:predicted metalloprotease with PDZ domain